MSWLYSPRMNPLSVEIYSSGTTLINDPDNEARHFVDLTFSKLYPGGLYGSGSFFIPRSILKDWAGKGAQRVVIRNGHDPVYEGYITALQYLHSSSSQGITVPLVGATEHLLMNYTWRKRWADARITEEVWRWDTTETGADKCDLDRTNRLKFVPKNVSWTADTDKAEVIYTMPTGEVARRVTFDYDFKEGGQSWGLGLWSSVSEWYIDADASGSQDITLSNPSQDLYFYFLAKATQTPAADGSIYGQISNLKVYSETGNIYMDEILKDVVAKFSGILNSDTQYIQSPGTPLSLVPYIAEESPSLAGLINEVVGFGDGNNARWAWWMREAEKAASNDGKPVLFLEQYKSISDYNYQVTLEPSANRVSDIEIMKDYSTIVNWVEVRYTDPQGIERVITPDDDATLKDQDSIDNYGLRALAGGLDVAHFDATKAKDFAKRYLDTYKSPMWRMVRPLVVRGYILNKTGVPVPTSKINPGAAIRILDFPDDENGEKPTFVITGTSYDHEDESCSITTGIPQAPFIPRLQIAPGSPPANEIIPIVDTDYDIGSLQKEVSSGGGRDRLNFYKRKIWKKALRLGFAKPEQFKKLTAKQKKALTKKVRKKLG